MRHSYNIARLRRAATPQQHRGPAIAYYDVTRRTDEFNSPWRLHIRMPVCPPDDWERVVFGQQQQVIAGASQR